MAVNTIDKLQFLSFTRYKCLVTGRMPACHILQYLPHDAMLVRYMLSLRVRLSVRTYGIRPSVTKTAKCRLTVVKCGQQAHLHMLSRMDDDGPQNVFLAFSERITPASDAT